MSILKNITGVKKRLLQSDKGIVYKDIGENVFIFVARGYNEWYIIYRWRVDTTEIMRLNKNLITTLEVSLQSLDIENDSWRIADDYPNQIIVEKILTDAKR